MSGDKPKTAGIGLPRAAVKIGGRLIVVRHSRRNEGGSSAEKPVRADGDRRARRHAPPLAPDWLWGWHAVSAALANPARGAPRRLLATAERARQLQTQFPQLAPPEIVEAPAIAKLLPPGAAHQGVALKAAPLAPLSLAELAQPAEGVLVMLDQVTDPQNVGAVFRSAAAFGARGVIVQDRHAPELTGALAKASAGAIDRAPHARVVNLARALDELADMGWRTVGLDGGAGETLQEVLDGRPTVLVLGSEGEGLRRLVGEHCDVLAKIPMPGGFDSLNISAAAAVALYEATRPR
jgi:23S rRNA (guanosine2251-2'-O)-methyltransferase